MRKFGIYFLAMVATMAIVSTGCSSKDSEKRIAELENRLKELESTGGNTATTTTTPQTQPEQKPDGPLPSFQFENVEHDFGTITDGDVVTHVFTFTNKGDAPLIIQSAKGSCGCTVPTWPREPIPVGGTGEIAAEFNSKGKPGMQNKAVTITANTWPKSTTLRIKAEVNPAGSGGPIAN